MTSNSSRGSISSAPSTILPCWSMLATLALASSVLQEMQHQLLHNKLGSHSFLLESYFNRSLQPSEGVKVCHTFLLSIRGGKKQRKDKQTMMQFWNNRSQKKEDPKHRTKAKTLVVPVAFRRTAAHVASAFPSCFSAARLVALKDRWLEPIQWRIHALHIQKLPDHLRNTFCKQYEWDLFWAGLRCPSSKHNFHS